MKRIMFANLRQWDMDHGDSLVRELEMAVDSAVTCQGQSIQFWRDMSLYGLNEAIQYLTSSQYVNVDQLESVREIANKISFRLAVKGERREGTVDENGFPHR